MRSAPRSRRFWKRWMPTMTCKMCLPGWRIKQAIRRHGDDVTCAHASAHGPRRREYLCRPEQIWKCIEATDARATFIGHARVPMVLYRTPTGNLRELHPDPGTAIPLSPACRYVVNVGSVGQPRDGNNAACYALYDDATAEVTIHRIPYDYMSAA